MQFMRHGKLALAVIAGALALTACGDPQGLIASLPTIGDVYTVYALNGTSASLPSGINTYSGTVVHVDGNAAFDVALDLDATGHVLVYPVQKVVTAIVTPHSAGLRRVTGNFDALTIAPTGNYSDSTVVLNPNEVVVVQSVRNGSNDACQFAISPYIYAKLTIDSVSLASRAIFVKAILNPNCGFRSFEPGIPTQ